MKFLLSVIALCLVMITAKLYIPQAQAKVGGMDDGQLYLDRHFQRAVMRVVKRKCEVNSQDVKNVISGGDKTTYKIDIDCD